jgi:hypothetical protein
MTKLRSRKKRPFQKLDASVKLVVMKGHPLAKMKVSLLTTLALTLAAPVMAATTNGVAFTVRQENGANQSYRIDVPPDVPPAKPGSPAPAWMPDKLSPDLAAIAAVAWAGGWDTNNGLTTVGGGKPGGFYNATHIKVDSVQQQASPTPYYLVQMEGNIGQSIQTFYAAVLEDGRIVEPTVVGTAAAPQKMKKRSHAKR